MCNVSVCDSTHTHAGSVSVLVSVLVGGCETERMSSIYFILYVNSVILTSVCVCVVWCGVVWCGVLWYVNVIIVVAV